MVTRRRGDGLDLRTERLPKVPEELQPLLGEDKPAGPVAVPAAAH